MLDNDDKVVYVFVVVLVVVVVVAVVYCVIFFLSMFVESSVHWNKIKPNIL